MSRPPAVLLFAALLVPAPPIGAGSEGDACEAYRIEGVRLGMASDEVRMVFDALGTPAPTDDGIAGSALLFEADGAIVRVELDRRPRRRRPGHVVGVERRREEASADAAALLATYESRLGSPDEGPGEGDDPGSGFTRRRWSSVECGARLELAIEEQVEWWQPRSRSVVVRLERIAPTDR